MSSHRASGRHERARRRLRRRAGRFVSLVMITCGFGAMLPVVSAVAAHPPVELGTASSFAVLAGSTVTNTIPPIPNTVVSGELGVSPGNAVTGFPPGQVINGTIHIADGAAAQAQADLTAAYGDAAGRTPVTQVPVELGNTVLTDGVYANAATGTLGLTGTLTLDGQNNPDSVFIFQTASTLITGAGSIVNLINGAQACNVFWQIGSSATLGSNSDFVGTVMALTSITATTGADVEGRLLARNGAVTLDANTITRPACVAQVVPEPTTTTTAAPTTTTTAAPTTTTTAAPTTTTAAPASTTGFARPGAPGDATSQVTSRLPETGLEADLAVVGALLLAAGTCLLGVSSRRLQFGSLASWNGSASSASPTPGSHRRSTP